LLIAYILAVNFYAFLLVKSLRDKELQQSEHTKTNDPTNPQGISSPDDTPKFPDKAMSKLFITGLLGGAMVR
jgi:hypothetical protein